MLDRIVKLNDKELYLIFTDRPPVTIYSSEGRVLDMYKWMYAAPKVPLTLAEFKTALDAEDTQCIHLKTA